MKKPQNISQKCENCDLLGIVHYQSKLESLYQLSLEVVALRDLQQVLDTSLRHCLTLTRSQFGFIGLTTDNDQALDLKSVQGFDAEMAFYEQFHVIPFRHNIFGSIILGNRPERFYNAASTPKQRKQPQGHPPTESFLGVPLHVHGQTIGMIGVANKTNSYTDEDEHFLVTYASLVAIAIHNTNLYTQLKASRQELERKVANRTRDLAKAKDALDQKARQLQHLLEVTVDVQEEERARIAHDMHDGLNQLIISALYETQSIKESLEIQQSNGMANRLEDTQTLLKQIDTEIRRIIYDLRPPILDAKGLAPAIKQFIERCQTHAQLACPIQITGVPYRLPAAVEISIYRLVQEALHNVIAHARATQVSINLDFMTDYIHVAIHDNGSGFDPDIIFNTSAEHMGLIGMKERTLSIGGQLDIHTRQGWGTKVVLTVPLEQHV